MNIEIPPCPVCSKSDRVMIHDKGRARFWRGLVKNNRFVCGRCQITWRTRDPHDILEFKIQRKK